MIRNGVVRLRSIMSKPTVLYSTVVTPVKGAKSVLIQKLIDEFTEAKPIILKLKKYDQMNINFNEWKDRINLMKKHNFSDLECFQVISEYPSVLEIPLCKLEESMIQWQLAELGIDNYKSVLLSQPVLLDIDEAVIKKRVPQLRVHFGSKNTLVRLFTNSPNVMIDNWQGVLERIEYLKSRRFNAADISSCPALTMSLDLMKFRFELLEKCGVYKQSTVPIHKVNKYDRSGHVNPSLKSILITDTKQFARIAKISVEEYEVYRDLFNSEEDEADSDSEYTNFYSHS